MKARRVGQPRRRKGRAPVVVITPEDKAAGLYPAGQAPLVRHKVRGKRAP